MKRILLLSAILSLAAIFISCSPKNASPEQASPGGPAGRQPRPAAEAGPGTVQTDWETLVSEARKERSLSLYTSIGTNGRQAIVDDFEKKYGLKVEFTSGRGNDLAEKIIREDKAGLHMADLYHSGTTTMLTSLKPAGVLAPIEPLLILPEVLDAGAYFDGKLPWRDENKVTMSILAYPAPSLFINTNLVKPDEIASYQDLLNPKWKGKIVMLDPLRGGSGQRWVHIVGSSIMGWDFIRELLKQDIMIHVDQPIMAHWLSQGKYAISIGVASEHVLPLEEAGAPVKTARPREGSYLTSGSFAFTVIRNPPHPNATKLFVNWALSKEGQTAYAANVRQHGVRVDIPAGLLMPQFSRQSGEKYLVSDHEEYTVTLQKNQELVKKIFEPYWK